MRGHWLVASAGLGSRLASSPRDVPGSDTGGALSHRRRRPSSQSVPQSTYCYVSGTFRSARNEWPADYPRALQTLRSKHRGAEWIPRSQAALGLRSPDVNPGRAVCSRTPHARPHRCPCPRWLPRGHKTSPARPFDFSKEARNLNFYIQKYLFLKPGK